MNETSGLTEEAIRSLVSEKSFARGEDYYRDGAIYNAWKDGDRLLAYCMGSSESPYQVQARLGEGKVLSAYCTCPYDWGGYCKHIVALLLTYIRRPEVFEDRLKINTLLEAFSREELLSLVERMVEEVPELYDWLALYTSAARAAAQEAGEMEAGSARGASAEALAKARRFDGVYRREVRRILEGLDEADYNEMYWPVSNEMVDGLEMMASLGGDMLKRNAPASALVAFQVLIEEVGEVYEILDDEAGDIDALLESLDMPLAEAILSVEIPEEERDALAGMLEEFTERLAENDSPGFGTALAALEHGWQVVVPGILDLEEEDEEGENWDEADWDEDTGLYPDDYYAMMLQEARLNVLERQGRVDDFLQLCEQTGQYLRELLKLVELGRVSEAVQVAEQRLKTAADCEQFAHFLLELGYVDVANRVRELGSRDFSSGN